MSSRRLEPENFEAFVRREERRVCPELFPTAGPQPRLKGLPTEPVAPEEKGSGWSYYPPSWHARNGLLDRAMLVKMQAGGSLLSIGTGPAWLEKFLVRMGASAKNIVIADISDKDMPAEFQGHAFNAIDDEWPDFGTQFDFVIFPESFSIINGSYEDVSGGPRVMYGWTREQWEALGGETRGYTFNSVSPALSGTWHLIQQAMEHLKPGGEMRASLVGPNAINNPAAQIPYLQENLHEQYGASFEERGAGLTVKKGL